jgi:ketosteroid isomerase-like protein
MAEHPNVPRVRSAYDAFLRGDLDAALADITPDCVFHFKGEGPHSGDHKGKEEIVKALVGTFELTGGDLQYDIKGIYADEDHAVVVLNEKATRAADGARLDVDEVHVIKLDSQGRMAELWDLPADPEAHNAFFDGR